MTLVYYSLSIFLAILIEATLIPIPLTLLIIIYAGISQKKEWVFLLGIVSGLLLDSLTFRFLGSSALFFLLAAGVLFLYQKKFETHHMLFGMIFTIAASAAYLLCFDSEKFVPALLIVTFFSFVMFGLSTLFQSLSKQERHDFIL